MAALAAVGAARLIAPPSLPLSRLHCPAERLELGTVWESDSLEVRLPLTNQGDGAVKIADFVNSCSCTQITPRQLVLEPGETREIQVRLDLRSSKRPRPPATERFEIMFQPRDESGRTLADLKLSGHVKPPFWLATVSLDFGERSDRETFTALNVEGQLAEDIERIEWTSGENRLQATIQAGKAGAFTLTVSPPMPTEYGSKTADLIATPIGSDGQKLPSLPVPVRWNRVPDIQADPPQVLFGNHPVGESLEDAVTLASRSGTSFTVERVEHALPGLTVDRDGESKTPRYVVKQKIEKIGQQSGTIRFHIRYGDGSTTVREVAVTSFGFTR
jgi:hypothetical protein